MITFEELTEAVETSLDYEKKAFQKLEEVTPAAKKKLQDLQLLARLLKHEPDTIKLLMSFLNDTP